MAMESDPLAPTGQFPAVAGVRCSACGRVESVAGARFCGACGSAMPAPGGQHYAPAAPPVVHAAPMAIVIPRVGLFAFARMGAALGAAFSLLPCLLFAMLGTTTLHWLRTIFDGWTRQEIRVPIVNAGLSMNFVHLLGMEGPYRSLTYWDDRLIFTFTILWIVPWLFCILGAAVFALLLAMVYNVSARVSGGVQLDVVPRR